MTLPRQPAIRGWCPGALRPMASGDGLVARIRPAPGGLDLRQIRGLAALAARHGAGHIAVSNRANLQIRGLAEGAHGALLDGLAGLGLLDENPEAEARRNILADPLSTRAQSIAAALVAALSAADLPALPGKFGYVIDPGAAQAEGQGTGRRLAKASGDIRLEAAAAGGLVLRADGAKTGLALAGDSSPAALAQAMVALARWFLAAGGRGDDGRGRMRAHLARGACLPPGLSGPALPAPALAPPQPGLHGGDAQSPGLLIALPFGEITAPALAALADWAESLWHAQAGKPADLRLRISPWRGFYLTLPQRALPGASAPPVAPPIAFASALICAPPQDPATALLLRLEACPGAPACSQALGASRDLARALAKDLAADLARYLDRAATQQSPAICHVSGCAKGCAHPGAAALTLRLRAPRPDGTPCFDLIAPGRADAPSRLAAISPSDLAAWLKDANAP